jgi:hypothetical protein
MELPTDGTAMQTVMLPFVAVGRGRSGPDRPRPTALLPPRSYGKPEAAAAVDRLLMMDMR